MSWASHPRLVAESAGPAGSALRSSLRCVHLDDIPAARDHARHFLAHFCAKITPGREPESGEPARWFLRVNPLRRSSDTDYLLGALVRAGIEPP